MHPPVQQDLITITFFNLPITERTVCMNGKGGGLQCILQRDPMTGKVFKLIYITESTVRRARWVAYNASYRGT
jgi:hypothetical protein